MQYIHIAASIIPTLCTLLSADDDLQLHMPFRVSNALTHRRSQLRSNKLLYKAVVLSKESACNTSTICRQLFSRAYCTIGLPTVVTSVIFTTL